LIFSWFITNSPLGAFLLKAQVFAQDFLKLGPGGEERGHHRSHGFSGDGGDFPVGKLLEIAQDDDFFQVERK
jgi:hypothetical protein